MFKLNIIIKNILAPYIKILGHYFEHLKMRTNKKKPPILIKIDSLLRSEFKIKNLQIFISAQFELYTIFKIFEICSNVFVSTYYTLKKNFADSVLNKINFL